MDVWTDMIVKPSKMAFTYKLPIESMAGFSKYDSRLHWSFHSLKNNTAFDFYVSTHVYKKRKNAPRSPQFEYQRCAPGPRRSGAKHVDMSAAPPDRRSGAQMQNGWSRSSNRRDKSGSQLHADC